MNDESIRSLKIIRHAALAVGVLATAAILGLMYLARGKTGDDGDIAGVVAPALLLVGVSLTVAAVAELAQKRAQRATPGA